MGAGLSRLVAPAVKAKLSEQQWEYVAFGPYPHWTQTRRALIKRGLYEDDGRTRTYLGDAVRALVLADLPRPDLASADTPPQGGDAKQAPFMSGAVLHEDAGDAQPQSRNNQHD